MSTYITKFTGESATLGVVITSGGTPISSESPTIEIRRTFDDLYFNFAAVSAPYWVSAGGVREGSLTEEAYQQGFYTYVFDHALYGDDKTEFRVIYRNPDPYSLLLVEIMSFSDGPEGPSNPWINITGEHTIENDNVIPDGTTHGSCT